MCRAVPGKIISIDESNPDIRMAKINFGGVVKDISMMWLPECVVGDYVMAHVGFALSKIDEDDALLTLQLLDDMGELPDLNS